ncbi:N-acetylmuramoyl-L-alanine amidase [Paenibacillus sp. sgz500958]|uniref:N-acetylmuramoyl-L-alanine amidase n=1 Tax=Paenibacillus sp. sgz500958 TaxID=3242475 RepID=UPI0036D2D8F2
MKKFGFMLLLLLFVLVFPDKGHASGNNKIYLDGQDITAGQDVPVENVNGSVMVPLKMITTNLGYSVNWDQKTQQVTVEQQGKTIVLVLNQKSASVDGRTVILNTAPYLRNNITLVPIRFISTEFGLDVAWDNAEKVVTLMTQGSVPVDKLSKVNGVSFSENRLIIAMEGTVKPMVSKLSNPDRIIVDLPNSTFSDVFGNGELLDPSLNGQLDVTGYPDVSGVRYSLFSSNPYKVRFVIDLNYPKNYTVSATGDEGSLVIVDLNAPDPVDTTIGSGKKLVVLDAGHGAKDSGAVGYTGKYEKKFNLAVILKAAALLKKESNIDVVLTRSDDTFLELKERAAIANNLQADLFISVHANSGASSSASGTETYYQREASKGLANVMHKYLVQATGLSDRGVRYGNFHVIRETKMPAVLLEVGYLSNKGDEALLFTEALQNRVAAAMVKGIKEYLGIK